MVEDCRLQRLRGSSFVSRLHLSVTHSPTITFLLLLGHRRGRTQRLHWLSSRRRAILPHLQPRRVAGGGRRPRRVAQEHQGASPSHILSTFHFASQADCDPARTRSNTTTGRSSSSCRPRSRPRSSTRTPLRPLRTSRRRPRSTPSLRIPSNHPSRETSRWTSRISI